MNIAFPGKTVPSTSEMESIVRIMVSELTAARGDEELKSKSFKYAGFQSSLSIYEFGDCSLQYGAVLASVNLVYKLE